MTVAGAARSGIAAARLLVERGARVTLSDARADVPEAQPLAEIGVALETRRASGRDVHGRRPGRA